MIRLIAVVSLALGVSARADILDVASQIAPIFTSTNTAGNKISPKYGHFEVDTAVMALKDIPRPWTVEKFLQLYASEKDPKRRAHIMWVLAASRDRRAALILGRALNDKNLQVRTAATYGLMSFFMKAVVGGGTEAHMQAVAKWWKENARQFGETRGEYKCPRGTHPFVGLLGHGCCNDGAICD